MVKSKQNTEHYKWGNHCDGWFYVKNENQTVILEHMPPSTQEQRHYHERSNQFFFMLKGTAHIEINGVMHIFTENEGIEVRNRLPHQIFNKSDEEIQFLVISQPPTVDDRINLP